MSELTRTIEKWVKVNADIRTRLAEAGIDVGDEPGIAVTRRFYISPLKGWDKRRHGEGWMVAVGREAHGMGHNEPLTYGTTWRYFAVTEDGVTEMERRR